MKMKKKILKTKEEKTAKKKAKLEAKMTFIVMSFLALVEQQISGFSNVKGVMGTYRRFRIWDREQDILHTGNKLALRYGEACVDLTKTFMEARANYEAHLAAEEERIAEEKRLAEAEAEAEAVDATEEE